MRPTGDAFSEIVGFLGEIPLLTKLSEESLKVMARECRVRQLDKGEILFLQSDDSDAAYIVRHGNISIVLNSPDGREMVINEMHCGDEFKRAKSTGVRYVDHRGACRQGGDVSRRGERRGVFHPERQCGYGDTSGVMSM